MGQAAARDVSAAAGAGADGGAAVSVVLGHAAEDAGQAAALAERLRGGGREVSVVEWGGGTAVVTPSALDAANAAVEAAGAFVPLVSAAAARREEAGWAVDHALQCGKRVVPVALGEGGAAEAWRPDLARLTNWVVLPPGGSAGVAAAAAARLLAARLDEDAAEVREHTAWLARAAAWQRAGRPRKLRLSRAEAGAAKAYLERCARRPAGARPVPVPLMLAHVAASAAGVMAGVMSPSAQAARHLGAAAAADGNDSYMAPYLGARAAAAAAARREAPSAYLSFAPRDAASARLASRLGDRLAAAGRTVRADWDGAAARSEAVRDMHESVERSDAVVVILSAAHLASEWVAWELERAVACGKRVVGVGAAGAVDFRLVPYELARGAEWVMFPGDGDGDGDGDGAGFAAAAEALEAVLDAEPHHAAYGARLLRAALQWDRAGRPSALLLRGAAAQRGATDWLAACAMGKRPGPGAAVLDLVRASCGGDPWARLAVPEAGGGGGAASALDVLAVPPDVPLLLPDDWTLETERAGGAFLDEAFVDEVLAGLAAADEGVAAKAAAAEEAAAAAVAVAAAAPEEEEPPSPQSPPPARRSRRMTDAETVAEMPSQRRRAELFWRYFLQLSRGCGDEDCPNRYCVSNCEAEEADLGVPDGAPDDAVAAQALRWAVGGVESGAGARLCRRRRWTPDERDAVRANRAVAAHLLRVFYRQLDVGCGAASCATSCCRSSGALFDPRLAAASPMARARIAASLAKGLNLAFVCPHAASS